MVVSKKIALFFYCKFEFDLCRVNYVTKGLGKFCFVHTNKTHLQYSKSYFTQDNCEIKFKKNKAFS